jgi:hypothetical protein
MRCMVVFGGFTNRLRVDVDRATKKWDNEPGGTVVEEFEQDGTKYVLVEFKRTPGRYFVYKA